MTTGQLRSIILEAVDCLRQRKCRPDRESIAVYVMRKLGSTMNEVFSEIENIVDQGSLLKVEYKGSTSYRSPKNFDTKNSPLLTKHSKILNSSKTTRYVISAINELLSTFPNYNQEGIPFEELKEKLIEFDKERFADSGIEVIFEREEAAGNIQKAQSEDPIFPIRIFPKDIQVPGEMKIMTFAEEAQPAPERKKRKRGKKEEIDEVSVNCSSSSKVENESKSPLPKKPKLKKKEKLVFAVKSDPHKPAESGSPESDSMQDKVDQISSISLKVIAGKGSARKTYGEGSRVKLEAAQITDLIDAEFDRKPSLALVNHDALDSDKAANIESDNESENCGQASAEPPAISPSSSHPLTSVKTGTLKKASTITVPKSSNKNLSKSDNNESEPEEQVALYQQPPLYTYGSKRRTLNKSDTSKSRNGSASNSISPTEISSNVVKCAYCQKENNSAGAAEDFLTCGTCHSKIHPACMDYSEDHAKLLRMNSSSGESHLQWQCFSCKRCGVCQTALMSPKNRSAVKRKKKSDIPNKNEQRYILCDQCDRGYHMKCITSTVPSDAGSWYCEECEKLAGPNQNGVSSKASKSTQKIVNNKIKNVRKGDKLPVVHASSSSPSSSESSSENGNQSEKSNQSCSTTGGSGVPDISTWTPSEVQKYFVEKGLQEEAASLREQEIDGMSLLLLRRADVIFGLNLRLGPALKIYRLVCQLQQHSSALKKKQNVAGSTQPRKSVTNI